MINNTKFPIEDILQFVEQDNKEIQERKIFQKEELARILANIDKDVREIRLEGIYDIDTQEVGEDIPHTCETWKAYSLACCIVDITKHFMLGLLREDSGGDCPVAMWLIEYDKDDVIGGIHYIKITECSKKYICLV